MCAHFKRLDSYTVVSNGQLHNNLNSRENVCTFQSVLYAITIVTGNEK